MKYAWSKQIACYSSFYVAFRVVLFWYAGQLTAVVIRNRRPFYEWKPHGSMSRMKQAICPRNHYACKFPRVKAHIGTISCPARYDGKFVTGWSNFRRILRGKLKLSTPILLLIYRMGFLYLIEKNRIHEPFFLLPLSLIHNLRYFAHQWLHTVSCSCYSVSPYCD